MRKVVYLCDRCQKEHVGEEELTRVGAVSLPNVFRDRVCEIDLCKTCLAEYERITKQFLGVD